MKSRNYLLSKATHGKSYQQISDSNTVPMTWSNSHAARRVLLYSAEGNIDWQSWISRVKLLQKGRKNVKKTRNKGIRKARKKLTQRLLHVRNETLVSRQRTSLFWLQAFDAIRNHLLLLCSAHLRHVCGKLIWKKNTFPEKVKEIEQKTITSKPIGV